MRTKKGIVASAKMTGTVSVNVDSSVFHPVYKKRFRRSKKFLADTNGHDLAEGDTVVITECRPLSKHKCFKVTEVLIAVPRVSDVKEEASVDKAIHREKVAPEPKKKEVAADDAEKKVEKTEDVSKEEKEENSSDKS